MVKDLSIVSNDEVDKDMFAEGDAVFQDSYEVAEERAAGLNEAYVLDLALLSQRDVLVAALSDRSCCAYDAETLVSKAKGSGLHGDAISGLAAAASGGDGSVFYTSSADATVKMWDLREGLDKEVRMFQTRHSEKSSTGGRPNPPKPLTALAASGSGNLICAGTEKVQSDTFLLFWDPRQDSGLLGGYWDSHEDDVTTVRFHPKEHSRMASGGVDGVINLFDVSQPSEDDALLASANTESSVQKLAWFGDRGLACVTHTEELHLWKDVEEDPTPGKVFTRDDVCISMKRNTSHTAYLVDCLGTEEGGLVAMAGSSCSTNPCLRLSTLRKNRLRPLADFKARKRSDALTRCAVFSGEVVYTGGEDGIVRMWKKGLGASTSAAAEAEQESGGKIKSKKKKSGATPY